MGTRMAGLDRPVPRTAGETTLGRAALPLPQFTFTASAGIPDDAGVVLTGEQPLHCAVEQPVQSPAP